MPFGQALETHAGKTCSTRDVSSGGAGGPDPVGGPVILTKAEAWGAAMFPYIPFAEEAVGMPKEILGSHHPSSSGILAMREETAWQLGVWSLVGDAPSAAASRSLAVSSAALP